jgi:hypothetical protein
MMDSDPGGWLLFVIDVVMVAVLAAGLIYGTISWRRRRRNRAVSTEQATKRLYERAADNERKTHGQ